MPDCPPVTRFATRSGPLSLRPSGGEGREALSTNLIDQTDHRFPMKVCMYIYMP
jgi:hypothetical protein